MPFPSVQIPIRYDGLDADRSEIDLIELGQSLHGAGKLIRSAGNVVFYIALGESCLTAQIGHSEHGAIAFDQNDRDAIESPEPVAIGEEATYEILISELDLKNRSCKFQIRGESEDKRFPGTITDPMIIIPSNPYSEALSERRWLKVKGKPEIIDGELSHLHISTTLT
jgi:hypothetical protein